MLINAAETYDCRCHALGAACPPPRHHLPPTCHLLPPRVSKQQQSSRALAQRRGRRAKRSTRLQPAPTSPEADGPMAIVIHSVQRDSCTALCRPLCPPTCGVFAAGPAGGDSTPAASCHGGASRGYFGFTATHRPCPVQGCTPLRSLAPRAALRSAQQAPPHSALAPAGCCRRTAMRGHGGWGRSPITHY